MALKDGESVSNFRRILPQVLATTVVNLLTIDAGLIFALPGIVIPALYGFPNEPNRNELLSITAVQSSWLSSIGYLIQPIGSMISTLTTDILGRRKSMMLVNVFFALGWFMLSQADAVWEVFFGMAVLGLAIGLREAAVIAYLGEICEPTTRGIMNSFSTACETIGMLVIFILNTIMPWREIALYCLAVPVLSVLLLCFIPETPQWLLSRNRVKHAEKSLMWLRGWVPSQSVTKEFSDLQRHNERSKSCVACIKQDLKCLHPQPTVTEKFAEIKRKRTIKPFVIILSLSFLSQFSGVLPMKPFIIQILKAFESPIPADQSAAIISCVDNFANIAFMALIFFSGKRKLYLTMLCGNFLASLVIACYGFIYLPSGINSFDQTLESFHLEDKNLAYIPLLALICWSFFSFCGIIAMPWILCAEIFSFKARGLMVGISAALNYTFGFISKKIYYDLETTLSLPGVSLLFSLICGFGLIWMYFIFPETEGRTLEDIELHFSDNSKRITDHHIAKSSNSNHSESVNHQSVHDTNVDVTTIPRKTTSFESGLDNIAFEKECARI